MAKVWYKQISSVISFCRQEFEVKDPLLSAPESFILKFLSYSFLWDAFLCSLRWFCRQLNLPVSSCTRTIANLELGLPQLWSWACRWAADKGNQSWSRELGSSITDSLEDENQMLEFQVRTCKMWSPCVMIFCHLFPWREGWDFFFFFFFDNLMCPLCFHGQLQVESITTIRFEWHRIDYSGQKSSLWRPCAQCQVKAFLITAESWTARIISDW